MDSDKPLKKSKKLGLSIGVFVVGIIALIVGVVFLILDLLHVPDIEDGEYLISAEQWVLDDGANCANSTDVTTEGEDGVDENNGESNCMPSVIWKFTEIGKGTLTTNGHLNDYDFVWAIRDGKLQIETKWLYDLENEYEYELNQREKTLTLIDGEKEIVFVGEFTDVQ